VALLNQAFDALLTFCAMAAATLLGAAAFAVCGDVVVRLFGIGSWVWATELTEYGLMAATFLGAPWVLRESAHVRVDFVVAALGGRGQAAAHWLANLLGLALCAGVLYFATLAMLRSFSAGSIIYQQFFVPEWWTLAPMPFCFLLMTFEFVRRVVRLWRTGEASESNSGVAI